MYKTTAKLTINTMARRAIIDSCLSFLWFSVLLLSNLSRVTTIYQQHTTAKQNYNTNLKTQRIQRSQKEVQFANSSKRSKIRSQLNQCNKEGTFATSFLRANLFGILWKQSLWCFKARFTSISTFSKTNLFVITKQILQTALSLTEINIHPSLATTF